MCWRSRPGRRRRSGCPARRQERTREGSAKPPVRTLQPGHSPQDRRDSEAAALGIGAREAVALGASLVLSSTRKCPPSSWLPGGAAWNQQHPSLQPVPTAQLRALWGVTCAKLSLNRERRSAALLPAVSVLLSRRAISSERHVLPLPRPDTDARRPRGGSQSRTRTRAL